MTIRIRLARWGARNNPFFGIVVANQRAPRDGNHLERVGTYNPKPQNNAKLVELNFERIKYWISVGAQPSDRVAFILSKANLLPATPKSLHKSGVIDVNDMKTWDIKVVDNQGELLETMEQQKAREQFQGTKLANDLPKLSFEKLNRINHDKIHFEKILNIEPQDRRLILKAYLGI